MSDNFNAAACERGGRAGPARAGRSRPRTGRAAAMLVAVLAASAVFAQGGGGPASRADAPSPIVPVHDEPHHRQVFQFGPTRILDLQIPPGDISWFHSHEWPVLYMTLGQSAVRFQNLGEGWAGSPLPDEPPVYEEPPSGPPARTTSTTGYFEEPVTHRIQNVGTGLFRAMVVVNETAGDDTTSVEAAGFEGEPELANRWFRSFRVRLEAGETTDSHEHNAPVVIFQAGDGRAMARGPMDFEFNERGQWAFYDAGAAHRIENTGDGAIELIEVEVRLE